MYAMANANCWEAKRCGRQPGAAKAAELGACPGAKTGGDANHGMNGDRVCWAIAGTLCSGQVQGTFAQKAFNCMQCDFYQAVRNQEGPAFRLLPN